VFRKILLIACCLTIAAWLAWPFFAHLTGAFLKPEIVISKKTKATTTDGYVHDISAEAFTKDVLHSEQPVFVDFYATWCGPCQLMAPVVEELAVEYKNKIRFVRVDIDNNPSLADRYQIQSIPSLVIFSDGKIVDGALGVTEEAVLRDKLDRVIGGGSSRR